jgi:hypothetical protein
VATFPNRMFSSFSARLARLFRRNPRPRATPPIQRPGRPFPRIDNQDIVVDGNRYEATVFVNCTLVYKGGELPVFVQCTFRQVKLRLEGEAFNTAQYLQSLYAIGLSPAAEKVAAGIQQDTLPLTDYPVTPPAVNLGTNYGQLALYSAILVIIAGLLGTALWYGFVFYPVNVVLASEPARPLFKPAVYDTMPALPAELADRYDQWKADQFKLLDSYGWVDKPQGVAHIPIDKAIELLAEQGLPLDK